MTTDRVHTSRVGSALVLIGGALIDVFAAETVLAGKAGQAVALVRADRVHTTRVLVTKVTDRPSFDETLVDIDATGTVASETGVARTLELGAQIVTGGVRMTIMTLRTEVGAGTVVAAAIVHRKLFRQRTIQFRTIGRDTSTLDASILQRKRMHCCRVSEQFERKHLRSEVRVTPQTYDAFAGHAFGSVTLDELFTMFDHHVFKETLSLAFRATFAGHQLGMFALDCRTIARSTLDRAVKARALVAAASEVGCVHVNHSAHVAELDAGRVLDYFQTLFRVLQLFTVGEEKRN